MSWREFRRGLIAISFENQLNTLGVWRRKSNGGQSWYLRIYIFPPPQTLSTEWAHHKYLLGESINCFAWRRGGWLTTCCFRKLISRKVSKNWLSLGEVGGICQRWRKTLLKLQRAPESPGALVKMQILIHSIWDRAEILHCQQTSRWSRCSLFRDHPLGRGGYRFHVYF